MFGHVIMSEAVFEYPEWVLKKAKQIGLNRIKQHFAVDNRQSWVYSEVNHPEWIINRVIAICRYRPDALGLIADFPCSVPDGAHRKDFKVAIWDDNLGYCGDLMGEFDYCSDVKAELERLDEYSSVAASEIWRLSESLGIPLGEYASVVFEKMIGADGVKVG